MTDAEERDTMFIVDPLRVSEAQRRALRSLENSVLHETTKHPSITASELVRLGLAEYGRRYQTVFREDRRSIRITPAGRQALKETTG